jgi:hypothetical protein
MGHRDARSLGAGMHSVSCAAMCVIAFTLWSGSSVSASRDSADVSEENAAAMSFSDEGLLKEYRGYRRLHAWSEHGQEAWLEAYTELKNGQFAYRVISERGSDMIRSRVLRAVLDREQALINAGDTDKADLSPENYEFGDVTVDADGSQSVALKPRRKDVLLVDGRMVLTPDGRDVVRVEGRLAKNPSFWTSLVNIVRRYATLGGVRVPVSTDTTAKIKFVGTSQLEIAYEYESVNGRPINMTAERR